MKQNYSTNALAHKLHLLLRYLISILPDRVGKMVQNEHFLLLIQHSFETDHIQTCQHKVYCLQET